MLAVNADKVSELMPAIREGIKKKGKRLCEERLEKDRFFFLRFSRDKIRELDEEALRKLIGILWAYKYWSNKEYLYREMIKSRLDTIRKAFTYLLYSKDPVEDRFDFALHNIRMMGASGISEVLAHHDSRKYPIWSKKTRKALVTLGIPETLLPRSTQISGNQYRWFCGLMQDVYTQIASQAPEVRDFFDMDFLLLFISTPELVELPGLFANASVTGDFNHKDVVEQLMELGDGLGFQVSREVLMSRGCKIDALWQSRIANLGTISYAFEVHRRGSRDSAILNLQRVWRFPSIQKVIIVSKERELDIFSEEISSLDENFRRSVGYLRIKDLHLALDRLAAFKEIINSLGLITVGSTPFYEFTQREPTRIPNNSAGLI